MFTGIVEEVGEVLAVERGEDSARLTVRGPVVTSDAVHGASIAVDGVCLTVVDQPDPASFTVDVMAETLRRTALADVAPGRAVNLERPVAVGGRLGGHVVQGHVDGTGTVVQRVPGERWEVVRIGLDAGLARYVVPKGSITVDGVSLTVVDVEDAPAGDAGKSREGRTGASFTVSLIPATLEGTTLGRRAVGDAVNLEVDVLAKYVERLTARPAAAPDTGVTP
ncbi:riboflavin synthase [Kineococcus xinjiangensis]|uniref:Riboflavin synthase n=1 Tax=Kineococcus xinjiangensis TaxID=512762 RepID=A0A2S6IP69_9ACTN|nr:riboflavin synthase [Kineococcus xinjiangensis]PPK96054.1 riboflavin synthase [Kineococcus xinjiangensis]